MSMRIILGLLLFTTLSAISCSSTEQECLQCQGQPRHSPEITVYPSSVTLSPLESVQFKAELKDAPSTEVEWSVVGDEAGSIDEVGLYTAPGATGTYKVVVAAKYARDASAVASVNVKIDEATKTKLLTVTPTYSIVETESTLTLTASSSAAGVSFEWSPVGGGSVDASGLFHAPSVPGVYEVVLTSPELPDVSATATIVVKFKTACPVNNCPAGTYSTGTSCSYASPGSTSIAAYTQTYNSGTNFSGGTVHLLQPDGTPTGMCAIAPSGSVTMRVPAYGPWLVRIVHPNYLDTYIPDRTFTVAPSFIHAVDRAFADMMAGWLGISVDRARGSWIGYVKKTDGTTDVDYAGTMTVRTNTGVNAFYADDDSGIEGIDDSNVRLDPTHPKFVLANLPLGSHAASLYYEGAVSTTTDNVIDTFPDSVVLKNIRCAECY